MPDQTLSDDIIFRCDRCNEELSKTSIFNSASLFGVVFLFGKQYSYFGITCPNENCNNTILTKYNATYISHLKKQLFFDYGKEFTDHSDPRFKYQSFSYNFDSDPNIKNAIEIYYRGKIGKGEHEFKDELEILDHQTGFYRTFDFFDYAIGPAISILRFNENDINKILKYENQTGLRVFPRYIVSDPLYSAINDFCWNYDLLVNFHKSLNLPFVFYDLRESLTKRKIMKNNDFLNILDIRHQEDISASFPDEIAFGIINQGVISKLSRVSDGAPQHHYTKEKSSKNIPPHDYICEKVWDSYHKSYMEDLLSNLARNFINEYLLLNQKINFCYNSIWNLREKYLKEIYDYVVSRKKRPEIKKRLSKSDDEWRKKIDETLPAFKTIISHNKRIYEIKDDLGLLASKGTEDNDVLLMGESGTGKELFTKAYQETCCSDKPFVTVNCGSIADKLFENQFFGHIKGSYTDAKENYKGSFEQADGGVLFLDEIGELDLKDQKRFLRAVESREIQPVGGKLKKVKIRIVYATNSNLIKKVQTGEFRNDLYQRISKYSYTIPDLRDRKDDVILLVKHFIKSSDTVSKTDPNVQPIRIEDECLDLLEKYQWPGNVRELKNEIERIVSFRLLRNDRSDIKLNDLSKKILELQALNTVQTKAKNRRKKNPGDEILIQFQKDGRTHESIADQCGVRRETVTRWYSKIRKKSQYSQV
jgi:transcriptional regulator with PAS, ATPase and Fis domain